MDKIKVFDGCFNPIKYIKNDDIFIVLTPEEKNVLMVTREKFNEVVPDTANENNKLTDKEYVDELVSNEQSRAENIELLLDTAIKAEQTRAESVELQLQNTTEKTSNKTDVLNNQNPSSIKYPSEKGVVTYVTNELSQPKSDIAIINSKIPSTATDTNKLVDKDFVDSIVDDINDSIDIIDEVTAEGLYNLNERKQDVIEDLETIRSGAALGETAYQKPQSGIPASDIANGVIPDVSQFITKSVNDLVNYYTKSETYTQSEVNTLIGSIQHFHYEIYASLQDITSPATNVLYLIGPTGSGSDKYEEYVYANNSFTKIGDTTIDLSGYVTTQALNAALADYVTSTDLTTLLSGKQDKIDATHKLNADLVDDSSTTHKFVTANEKETWNSKQNALVSGTNIKTINNQSVLGSGNLDVKDIFWVEYYTTPFADILAAYNAGKTLFANYAGMKFVNTAVGIENDSNAFLFSMSGVDENDKIFIFSFAVTSNNGSTDYSNIYSKMLQEELISGTNIKSINNESILGAGNVNFAKYEDTLISSDAITCEITETVEGVSVYSSNADYYLQPNQKIVFADTVGDNTLYIINYDDLNNPFIISSGKGTISWNNFTNNDVRIQLASSNNIGQTLSASRYWRGTDDVFIAEYGVTTVQEIQDALNTGKIIVCHRIESNEAVYYQLSVSSSQYFHFYCMVGPTCYVMNLRKSDNMWSVSTGPLEQTTNKATNFTTLNNVKYPTTKAVADYAQPLPFIVNVTINPEGTSYTIDKTMTAIVTAHTTHKQLRLHCLWAQYSIEFEEDLCMFTTVDEQQNQHNYFVAHTVTEGIHYIVTIYYEDSTTKVRYQRVLDSDKQDVISDLSTIRSGAAAGATAYQKPSSGIPASDIAAGVIPDVSNFITSSVNNLVNYYLKSETYTKQEVSDLIGAINQFHYEVHPSLADITTPESNVLYLIGPQGAGTDLYEEYVYPNSTQGLTKIGDTSIDLSGYVTLEYLNTELVKYAKTNEYYPQMRVGSADKVLARIEDTDTYLIRETGGADNEVLNGEAPVLGFEGNATGWNQLVQNGDFSDGDNDWNPYQSTIAMQNDCLRVTSTGNSSTWCYHPNVFINANHKYYVAALVKCPQVKDAKISWWGGNFGTTTLNAGQWTLVNGIGSTTDAGSDFRRFCVVVTELSEGDYFDVKYAFCLDLTLLNSELANKANLTVAEVEDYLAHNIGLKPYYAYNPGTLLPANIASVSSIKSVNLLNPATKQARLITYSTTEGVDNQYTVKRLPDDAALSFTPDITGVTESVTIDSNGHFVIPSVGTLSVVSGGNPYSGDVSGTYVCITWDGTKDGTPDAFEEDIAEIDFAEIYTDNNGVKTQVCPTGMKMADFAGTVRDKLILNANNKWEFVQNVGDVDLGTLSWVKVTSIAGADNTFASGGLWTKSQTKIINPKYIRTNETAGSDMPDKSIATQAYSYPGQFFIKDSTYNDKDTFTTSLSGVHLFYELVTPVTYTNLYYKTGENTYVPLEDYILATYVNNWATQSVNTYPYVDGTPVAIPPRITQEFIIDQEESLDTIKADIIALSENKEDKSNKVTSFGITPTDVHYPSEKLVKDSLDLKQTALTDAEFAEIFDNIDPSITPPDVSNFVTITLLNTNLALKENTSNKVISLSNSSTDTQYPSAKCVYDYIATQLGNINSILETI